MTGTTVGTGVELVEVAPRDGLQNLSRHVSTAQKVELVLRADAAGVRRIEVTSFVHPGRVPQMADAEAVMTELKGRTDARLSALVLNQRGAERAVAAGVDEATFVLLATETFNQRNQGTSVEGSLEQWRTVAATCHGAGIPVTFMVGAAFGCPFEGRVDHEAVLDLVASGLDASPSEVALADTIGCGVPTQVARLVGAVVQRSGLPTRVHLHNTRNTGYANAYAAVQAGAVTLDASIGGLGGCPFAPAATGNIATEDLAWMFGASGVDLGLDVDALIETATWLDDNGLKTDSLLPRAGAFPG